MICSALTGATMLFNKAVCRSLSPPPWRCRSPAGRQSGYAEHRRDRGRESPSYRPYHRPEQPAYQNGHHQGGPDPDQDIAHLLGENRQEW